MKRKSKADKSNKTKPITAFISSGGHEILVEKTIPKMI
jgi:hypothetical protein